MAKKKTASEYGSEGGRARAKKLTPEERSEIARNAVLVRWQKEGKAPPPMQFKAIKEARMDVAGIQFDCAVLDDQTRVISERAFARALGAKRGGSHWQRKKHDTTGADLPVFLSANNLKPFISIELAASLSNPIVYTTTRGNLAHGTRAELIPQILDVWLKADEEGKLTKSQEKFARLASILMRGLATTGIIALIDEATGFQADRARDALARILEEFVAKELRKWVSTFPAEFYKELCRIRGWPFRENFRLPRYAGKLTDDLVYQRLAPGVRDELRRLNPVTESGRRRHKHHQWLSEKTGHPKLKEHVAAVTALMAAADDWDMFQRMVDKALPRQPELPLFKFVSDS